MEKFKIGERVVVRNYYPEYEGLVGTVVSGGGKPTPGVDFHKVIAGDRGTHSLRGDLPERTGRYIPAECLSPAKQHFIKIFKEIYGQIS